MATDKLTVTVDGVTDIPRLPGQSVRVWDGTPPDTTRMDIYSVYHDVSGNDFEAVAKLSGSNWQMKYFRITGEDHHTTIRDLDNGADRRIELLELGFNSTVQLISTRAKHITGWDGDKHDVQLGSGYTASVSLDAEVNILRTGSGDVGSIRTNGKSTIEIGDVYVGSVSTGNGNDKVTTGAGWVEAIVTRDGNDIVKIGTGSAALVRTGDGNDIVNATSGWVEMISTGDGKDTVTIGKHGAGAVWLSDGNDTIKVRDLTDGNNGVQINGGRGNDTLDFGGFSKGIHFSLDERAAYQNVAASNPNSTKPLSGWFSESSIENLSGTKKGDTFTGDAGANKLIGRGGNDDLYGFGGKDMLIGGTGRDVLDGGRGNDMLRGNGGPDVFVFGKKSGTDTVKDYRDGTDILRLDGHTGGFADLTISKKAGDKVIVHDGGTIVLDGKAGVNLTASDFDFV
ncbi:MAG: hypothetical protein KDK29_20075 [Sedimentitalea sp.]|nr:hypothetical protein [Sedimentitalea sp.]